jgi:hypothetical protein
MPTVYADITSPDGLALPYVDVRIRLFASTEGDDPGYAEQTETFGPTFVTTDEDGHAELTLRPNSDFVPPGTVSEVTETHPDGRSFTYYISVPDGAGPYWVGDILTDPPGALAPGALSAHLADPSDAHDASAISFVPTGSIAATTVQGALAELATEETASLAAHVATSPAHGNTETAQAAQAAAEATAAAALTAHIPGDPHTQYQRESERGQANGYAQLDSGGTVPDGQLPPGLARDSEVTAAVATETARALAAEALLQPLSAKGQANGYASLDSGGHVPDAQLPAGLARDTEVTAAIAAHSAAADPHGDRSYSDTALALHAADTTAVHGIADTSVLEVVSGSQAKADAARDAAKAYSDATFIPLAQRGAAAGVATLDGGGKVPTSQLPSLAITETFPVASQAAMLALTAQKGDVAVRTDQHRSYILAVDDPTVLANWLWMETPTDLVLSVDGRVGVIDLSDRYDASGAAAAAVAAHVGAADPHADRAFATAAIATHTGLPNAHHNRSHVHDGADGSGTVAHAALTGMTANDHHGQAHALAGADHTLAGGTAGFVPRASGAAAFAWARLGHADLGAVGVDDHHAQLHAAAHKGGADNLDNYYGQLGAANVWTADQTVTKTRPRYILDAGGTTKGRFMTFFPDQTFIAQNVDYTGAVFNLDDTSKPAWYVVPSVLGDYFAIGHFTAGANPRTPTDFLRINNAGQLQLPTTSSNGGLLIGGDAPLVYQQATGQLGMSRSGNAGTVVQVTNVNAGSSAYAQIGVNNASGIQTPDQVSMGVLGTGWTTSGAFKQDGGFLCADANISGGLSIMAAHSSGGVIRFYTGGFADANEAIRIGTDQIIQNMRSANEQTTVGAAGGASAPPATPTKWWKVKGSDNVTYVIPMYAAA